MNFKSYKQQILQDERTKEWDFEPDDRNHYVYRITNTRLDTHYYGSRSTNRKPKDDLGIHYFSSSTDSEFYQTQFSNPQEYKYKVVRVFDNKFDMITFESYLHRYFDVRKNDSFYNRNNQHPLFGFDSSGMTTVLDNEGKGFRILTTDERYLSGEFKHFHIGLKRTEETKKRMSLKQKEIQKEIITVKDSEGNTLSVKRDDERFLSGELVHFNTDLVMCKVVGDELVHKVPKELFDTDDNRSYKYKSL